LKISQNSTSLSFADLLEDDLSTEKTQVIARFALWGYVWQYNLPTRVEFLDSPSRKLFNKTLNCEYVYFYLFFISDCCRYFMRVL